MNKVKPVFSELGEDVDGCFIVGILREDVVVPTDEHEFTIGKIPAHVDKIIPFAVAMAVDEVAEDEQPLRTVVEEECCEPPKVVAVHLGRDGNPGFSEMCGFSNVDIGNDKCAFFTPQGSFGSQELKGWIQTTHVVKGTAARAFGILLVRIERY